MVSFDVVSFFTKVPIQLALHSTNFTFCGKLYKQVFGTATGSPVSSVVANLVMENIETRALETFADPPRLWKRLCR